MRRLLIAGVAVVLGLSQVGQVSAESEATTSPTETPLTTEVTTTVATTTPVTQTTVVVPVTTTTDNPCLATGYVCGWAVLDDSNNVTNVIVCDYSVCGSGTFANMRVVLQARQLPSGNVAGYNGGSYNPDNNVFTVNEEISFVGGSDLNDVFMVETTTTTEPDATGDPRVTETTEMSVSQAGSRQSRTVSAPKRQSVKKCVKPLRGMARKCLTSRSPLPTLVLPTKGRTWTPTSRQEGKQ